MLKKDSEKARELVKQFHSEIPKRLESTYVKILVQVFQQARQGRSGLTYYFSNDPQIDKDEDLIVDNKEKLNMVANKFKSEGFIVYVDGETPAYYNLRIEW